MSIDEREIPSLGVSIVSMGLLNNTQQGGPGELAMRELVMWQCMGTQLQWTQHCHGLR